MLASTETKITHNEWLEAQIKSNGANIVCLVLEWLPGATLESFINAQNLDWDIAGMMGKVIVQLTTLARMSKVWHTDMHPGNIMITEAYEPIIIDFGGFEYVREPDAWLVVERVSGMFLDSFTYRIDEATTKKTQDMIQRAKDAAAQAFCSQLILGEK